MRVASEGLLFIGIAALVAAGAYAAALDRESWPLWTLAAVLTVFALWVAYFFRDPERTGERGRQLVIAPADGKVVMITDVDEPAFLHGRAMRISIFMSVFNVHVNRYPVSGTVEYRYYNPGKFLHAAREKASLDNEQSSIGVRGPRGPLLVRQIAGSIARRIVTDAKVGDPAVQAERLGMIRFGSRVDVFLPASANARVAVKVGDKVHAAATVLAEYP